MRSSKSTNLAGEEASVLGLGTRALVVLNIVHLARLRPPQELELTPGILIPSCHIMRCVILLHSNSKVNILYFVWTCVCPRSMMLPSSLVLDDTHFSVGVGCAA